MLVDHFFYITLDNPGVQYLVLGSPKVKNQLHHVVTLLHKEPFEAAPGVFVLVDGFYWIPRILIFPDSAPSINELVPKGKILEPVIGALIQEAEELIFQAVFNTFGYQ